jgi:hypothetical protein
VIIRGTFRCFKEESAMIDPIQHAAFKRASMATAASVIRLLKTDAAAFGDGHREQSPRLTAAERLERLRQRRTA